MVLALIKNRGISGSTSRIFSADVCVPAPAVGGAMDLAAGAKRLWVLMEHTTKDGQAKLVTKCTYPLTAQACVKRVYTNLATIDVTERGFVVLGMAPGLTLENLQARTDAKLHLPA